MEHGANERSVKNTHTHTEKKLKIKQTWAEQRIRDRDRTRGKGASAGRRQDVSFLCISAYFHTPLRHTYTQTHTVTATIHLIFCCCQLTHLLPATTTKIQIHFNNNNSSNRDTNERKQRKKTWQQNFTIHKKLLKKIKETT